MKHLDFVDEFQRLGISLRSTTIESEIKEFKIPGVFETRSILMQDYKLRWADNNYNHDDPFKALLAKAVDMDSWKHSWHIEMIPENYKRIEDIIQKKIIDRANEIDELMTIYFQLHYEMSQNEQVEQAHLKAEQAMSKLQKIDIEVRELTKI